VDGPEESHEEKLEKIVNNLLIEVFPCLWYKVPRLSYSLQPEDLSQGLSTKKLPKKLTQTHFAILSYLRLQKNKTILQSELYKKLGWESLNEKKFSRKAAELKKLRFLNEDKSESDRRKVYLSISEKGSQILKKAEEKRKKFLLDLLSRTNVYKLRSLTVSLSTLIKI